MLDLLSVIVSLTSVMSKVIDAKAIQKKYDELKNEYKSKTPKELEKPLEIKRRKILDELGALQTKSILEIENEEYLEKIMALLLSLSINVYESKISQELDIIVERKNQVHAFIKRYEIYIHKRKRIQKWAVGISITLILIIFLIAILSEKIGLSSSYRIPILNIPITILMWSIIGSFTSLLYRFNKSTHLEIRNPLRWLVTRPITGIIMGMISYLIIRAGLLTSFSIDNVNSFITSEVMLLIAFVAGFSDVFSDKLLKTVIGRLTNDDENFDLIDQINNDHAKDKKLLDRILNWGSKDNDADVKQKNDNKQKIEDSEKLNKESDIEPEMNKQPIKENKTVTKKQKTDNNKSKTT
jgi:hypothetical protein